MSTEAGFLADIVANPDDDMPRLIFADWLEDNGDLQRANLIRAQCKLVVLEPYDPARLEVEEEAQDLLAEIGKRLEASLPEAVQGCVEWKRGFPYGVATTGPKFLRNAKKLFATSPLESLTLVNLVTSLEKLVDSNWLSRLREFNTVFTRTGEELGEARRLLESARLTKLRSLTLVNLGWAPNDTDRIGVQLAGWAGLNQLRRLTLRGCSLHEEDLRILTASPNLGPIESLDLLHTGLYPAFLEPVTRCDRLALRELDLAHNNSLGVAGARLLAQSPHLAGLRSLRIDSTNLLLQGIRALAESPHLAGLRSLIIGGNVQPTDGPDVGIALASGRMTNLRHLDFTTSWLGDRGVTALAKSEAMANLVDLELSTNNVTNAGAAVLAASPHLGRLERLGVGFNAVDVKGVIALLDSPRLPGLRCLSIQTRDVTAKDAERMADCAGASRLRRLVLDHCPLLGRGARAYATSPHYAGLSHLSLVRCEVRDEGAIALAQSPHLVNLRELNLSANGIGLPGVQALAASPNLPCLRVLRLSHNNFGHEGALALARSPYLNRLMVLEAGVMSKADMQALRERFGSAARFG